MPTPADGPTETLKGSILDNQYQMAVSVQLSAFTLAIGNWDYGGQPPSARARVLPGIKAPAFWPPVSNRIQALLVA